MVEQFVNNVKDNHASKPQVELVAGDEVNEKSRLVQEKEGRAINFPLGIANNNQNSTMSDHMQGSMNFVTTSTEKTNVMSFFDLSDVSMDHDDPINEHREMDKKVMKTTTTTTTTEKQTIAELKNNNNECNFNGTSYKAS